MSKSERDRKSEAAVGEGGMWPPSQAFYVEAMLFCTTSALNSVSIVSDYLETKKSPLSQGEMLDQLQNIVTQAAAISRFLWPPAKAEKHQRRGKHLRSLLSTDDKSALRSRDLRNMIEHLDEHMDEAFAEGVAGHIIPTYIGRFDGEPEVPTYFFRAYYFNTGVFEVLKRRFSIQPIADEIFRIHNLLDKISSR